MEDVRIGVYICWCGTNIAKVVDVEKVAEEMENWSILSFPETINICVPIPDKTLSSKILKNKN